jgi:predicted LPLAT superfamily acyltransferase
MPAWFNRLGSRLGVWIALVTMPCQRAHSRAYLRIVLGREPRLADVREHFAAFTRYLLLRLAIAGGHEPRVCFAPGQGDELRAFLAIGQAALYGTVHAGNSDLVGFFIGHLGGHLHMIRKRVGNSEDTERLARRYAGHVSYIWINDWKRLILAMNDALRAGHSLAMQCDRPEYSSKLEAFRFLGAERLFPFTIYYLAIMHSLPVIFAYAMPVQDDDDLTEVSVRPIFWPDAGASREEKFAAARQHFQEFLDDIEGQLRRRPYLWFNFTAMNPVAALAATSSRSVRLRTSPA